MTAARAAVPAVRPPPTLDSPLGEAGVARGAHVARLRRLGIHTVRDLVFHLPRRYDDLSRPMSLRALREHPPDGPASATVELVDLRVEPGFRRRVQRTVARLRDATGEGEAVWFGRRYVERRLAVGDTVTLSGKVELRGWLPRFANPDFAPAAEGSLHSGRIVPVYRLTDGVTGAWLRTAVRAALDAARPTLDDYLPPAARAAADDPPELLDALEWVHFPPDFGARDRAVRRLAFDELLALQVGMVARDRQRRRSVGEPIVVSAERRQDATAVVEQAIAVRIHRRIAADPAATDAPPPEVSLTDDQRAAIDAIVTDLGARRPMLRLLQGDVGSGKTAVAALAMAFVADVGGQAALLAPTDLLARQHAQTLGAFLEPLGHGVVLLTGSLPQSQRRLALEALAAPVERSVDGTSRGRIVVGTHALVQESVDFADLRLIVVDEQHRFGVAQREALEGKGRSPHVLLMTATPIPRTLGQIVHADLDVSDLRTPPAGRLAITTGIRRSDQLASVGGDRTKGAFPLIVREVAAGHRAFVVVPLVEEDDGATARSVDATAELLRQRLPEAAEAVGVVLPELAIETVHGQMRAADRDARMERFRAGAVQVLVGTTVLEVGVDVPEATVMLILDADRFGVAQLHQLRGRVGRGEAASYCILVSELYPDDETVRARLEALRETQDGFVLAELDLEQRREGELLGLHQSGLPPLRVASLLSDRDRATSVVARGVAEDLVDDEGRLRPGLERLGRELRTGWLARVGAGDVIASGLDADG